MEKITNVSALEYVLKNCELPTAYVEKLEKMKATFEKKNASGSNGKPTKNQIENEVIKQEILAYLATVENGATVTEIQKALTNRPEISNQKVNALVFQLKDKEYKVVRFTEKRKAMFKLA